MFGSPLLEVVLTLLAVYGGLAAVCSAAGEWVAAWRCWRSRVLASALREVLTGAYDSQNRSLLEQFFEAPLIHTLTPPDDHARGPSYLPAWAFTETVLRLIKPPEWEGGEPITFNDYARIVQQLSDSDFKVALETIGRCSGHDMEPRAPAAGRLV